MHTFTTTTSATTTITTNNNNNIKNNIFFSLMEKDKHRQPTMKHHVILSLISEQNLLISGETSHYNVNLCTIICNTNNGKISCIRLKLLGAGVIKNFINR
jgi:hypothetical protein